MLKALEFCIPTRSTTVPDGPDWLHEIKYDGYLLRVERNGDRGLARQGWTERALNPHVCSIPIGKTTVGEMFAAPQRNAPDTFKGFCAHGRVFQCQQLLVCW
jgi:hypothetical protein